MQVGIDITKEQSLLKQGYTIIGIDEVGRGCLAGPVYTCAFLISNTADLQKLSTLKIKDSKKLSKKKRKQIFQELSIFKNSISITSSSVSIINSHGIVKAVHAASQKAVNNIINQYKIKKPYILADNLCTLSSYFPKTKHASIVKGDEKHISIAASSIVAKVKRDTLMTQLHDDFPKYLWNKNKGYATNDHRKAIKINGPTPHHRTHFIKKLV